VLTLDELRQAERPHKRASIHRAADFTLGTHIYLLKEEKNWGQARLERRSQVLH